jgi:hypothetical protein
MISSISSSVSIAVNRLARGGCRRTVCHMPTAQRLVCRT